MDEPIRLKYVTIGGIGHYVDPFLEDGDRTWCGDVMQPFITVTEGWTTRAQECPDCQKKKEEANVAG